MSIPKKDNLITQHNRRSQNLRPIPDQSHSLQRCHFCFTPTLSIQTRALTNIKKRRISSLQNTFLIPENHFKNSRVQLLRKPAQQCLTSTNRRLIAIAKESDSGSVSSNIYDEDSEERKVLDSVADTGGQRLEAIRSSVNEDLEKVCEDSEQLGSDLIEQSTVELLELYNNKREEVLENVATDRDLIEEEVKKLEQLTKARERSPGNKSESSAHKITFAVTGLFTVGAFFYAWNGLVDGDSVAIQNAAVDAGAAAICAYFLSRSKSSN